MTLDELSRAIADRAVSCRHVVQAHLDRIAAVNGALNAMVNLDAERALGAADERDAEIAAGRRRGPLHGVPFTIKDCFSTAGLPTTCGVKAWVDFAPSRDAAVVRSLRRAGAILLGKTSLPPFLSSFETDNEVVGRTSNPYSPLHSAGGSSGGEAAIVAACGSAFGVGSDRGGSIRVPCHYCGVAGLKPTVGTISALGHLLLPIGPLKTEPGPIARRVEDLLLIMDVLAVGGLQGGQASGGLTIAYYSSCDGTEPDLPVRSALQKAVGLLREAGHRVEQSEPPGLDRAKELVHSLSGVHNELFGKEVIPEFFEPEDRTERDLAKIAEAWPQRARERADRSPVSGFEYFAHEMRLDILRAEMDAFMEPYDAIVCPVTGSAALFHGFTKDPTKGEVRTNTFLYSLSGNPAVTVPAGLDGSGLPVGLQVVGRKREDRRALQIAALLEKALGGWTPPPL
jgi:amidase